MIYSTIIERHEGHKQLSINTYKYIIFFSRQSNPWQQIHIWIHYNSKKSITVGSLSVAFAGGSTGEVCSAPSACTAMPSGALFRGRSSNGDMAHGLEVRHWEFANYMDWESCLDNFSSYLSNSSQFLGQPQPRQEVLLPDFFWWHFYSLKHCPWPRTLNYKSLAKFWYRNTMLEAGCMKFYHVAAYLPVGFLSLTQHVGAENCGGHSCWESTNQEHHSVEEHRWPGSNEAVNHFVPGSHCMVKVSWTPPFSSLEVLRAGN